MVEVTGKYQGNLHCQTRHGPSGSVLTTDAPKDNQGQGEAFSPTDLVATAFGTCIATTMAIAARKHGVELRGLQFKVTKEMSSDLPRRIARLTAEVTVPIPADHPAAKPLEGAARACPVHHSLHPDVEKVITFRWA
ncbi:MAG: OsmC family protein [Verrucomicrobia bacterium]|nr:OsmC family protein [Verrucomicrobiota bacterium]